MKNPTALVPVFTPRMTEEEIAAAAFLARYTGDTRATYLGVLKLYFAWCAANGLNPLEATRVHVEFFGRYLEEDLDNCPATVHRKLSTLKGFYRIALADERITKDPTVFLRMPKVMYDEARTLGLDRMELGKLIMFARASSPDNNALVTLMGLLGLRVSEACDVQIEDFQHEVRGHQVLRLLGKGGKPASIPLPVPVLRALRECAGDRKSGPLIRRKSGEPMDRRAAYARIKSLAKKAGLNAGVHPHTLRHAAITAALDAGAPLRDAQIFARHSDPRITTRYDRGRQNLDRHAAHLVAAFVAGAA